MRLTTDQVPPCPAPRSRRRIAVIGGGIAGMSAAWLLSLGHEVTLFERDGRLGGHANTIDIEGRGGPVAVDTGFIVYNPPNYPNLTALFDHLGVETQPTRMSFAVSLRRATLEYSSRGYGGIFGQPSNLVRPAYWSLLSGIVRFYRKAEALAGSDAIDDITLGQFLDRNGSAELARDHVLPMCAAIWSATTEDIRAFPLKTFLRFFANHGLFDIAGRAPWRTVTGGSREYVRRLAALLNGKVMLGRPVARVLRRPAGIELHDAAGETHHFNDVVIATHGDQALRLLADPTPAERRILGAFRTTANRAVVHDDSALMPRRRRAWAAWNYVEGTDRKEGEPLSVSYWMNELQRIPHETPVLVTLNPGREPRPGSVRHVVDYTHPLFDRAALEAQGCLGEIQGRGNTWFCGSYFGYGFHEDALQSGLAAAEMLGGVARPWRVANPSGRMPPMHVFSEAAE